MISGEVWYTIYDCLISASLTMLIELLFEIIFSLVGYKIYRKIK